jgi:hypothetical protein
MYVCMYVCMLGQDSSGVCTVTTYPSMDKAQNYYSFNNLAISLVKYIEYGSRSSRYAILA